MQKLTEVEEAKRLMTEAMEWSAFQWLGEKGRVREIADKANAALDQWEGRVKARWRDELKAASQKFDVDASGTPGQRQKRTGSQQPAGIEPDVKLFLAKVKRADGEADRARMDAEKTFDEAEKLLSTDLAREGCQQAIHAWELKEKAIRQAEAGMASSKATT